ncbi:Bug family tripartite tricarboxylate transporter substrate binding protein [Pararhodobacter aggregans]|uniref:Tripartite tricarboxylate transporter substrate binding protein n=1 Tax=Pararhodobacter aggregans TaxID=404875 RepID=A0A2T7UWI1_9RHOB|nr:tripartite tricarboxylate transporter substrate binding protein [Pararhodobacter aggregans]PTX04813.1 tripartite-type tricarboxylate transporter receptor subunit TctC [Pararhodobacter aggregans]PVE49143.1 hypothetical protein DDE23_01685 [Pararhodobacter aggregans]
MTRFATLTRSLIAATALMAPLALPASADTFPERDVTIVLPFPPGGGTDQVMRVIAAEASQQMGHQLIVENRPGAGGSIAAMYVKNAEADGYTLFFGNASTHAINPYLMNITYDPVADFAPVTEIMLFPHVLVVPGDSEIQTLDDLLAAAAGRPGGLSFATQGLGSGGQLLGEQLRLATGANMVAVPFQGGGPALLETSTGRVDFMFSGYGPTRSFVNDGTLRVIAVTGSERLPFLPDVPSLGELGYPQVNKEFWFAVFAPAGTPEDVVTTLSGIFAQAVATPAVQEVLDANAATARVGDPAALADLVARDLAEMEVLTREAGIAAN